MLLLLNPLWICPVYQAELTDPLFAKTRILWMPILPRKLFINYQGHKRETEDPVYYEMHNSAKK